MPGAEVTEQHVAGYLAKYATKATEPAGHLSTRLTDSTVRLYTDPTRHTGRLVAAAWELGRPDAGEAWSRLRPWAHMLGFGGHFATKSRAYSTTFTALRTARATAMRRTNATSAHPEQLPPDDDLDTVLVVGSWTYAEPAGAPPPTPPSPSPPPTRPAHDDPSPQSPDRSSRGQSTVDTIPERLWSAADVSAFLGVPVATLHQWRYLGTGPRAYRVGRWLRYDPAEVIAWLKRDVA